MKITNRTGTIPWHLEIIKHNAFRGKLIELIPSKCIIKVPTKKAVTRLDRCFNGGHGIINVEYTIQKLGLFECWFPRYQFKRIFLNDD